MISLLSLRGMGRRIALVSGLACVFAMQSRAAPPAGLEIRFDNAGITSLRQNGTERLYSNSAEPYYGTLEAQNVRLRRWDGTAMPAESKAVHSVVRGIERQVKRTYSWGTLQGTFIPVGDRLNITVTLTNTSAYVLESARLQLLTLRFPKTPRGFSGASSWTHNVGQPGIIEADFGSGVLAIAIEEIGRPLRLGFPSALDPANNRTYQLQLSTEESGVGGGFPGPTVRRPLYPGSVDTYRLSLRFGGPGTPMERLTADVITSFATTFPPTLQWKDRRPIGSLHLSASEARLHSPSNPRGWFADPQNVDVMTDAGRVRFRERLLQYADNSIRILKAMNAQGMIVWDTEGQEYPHATSYLGDPRSLPPEMEPVADAFFQKFRDAGLRIGMTIRPQIPVRAAYGPEVRQTEVTDAAQNLIEKIGYAKKRWGCTLFYVDSNVHFDVRRAPNDGDAYRLMEASLFQEAAAAHPDVLLFPEHENARYFAYTAPYNELRGGITSTPALVRAIYPNAFSLIYVPDAPLDEHRKELVAAVRQGDILLFRAWFDDEYNAKVQSIYEEASTNKR